uniref:Secreted protein n=1 Tax=Arundo donax TaxID=35708 RepID=A0A0A9H199_ARUDO
MVTFDCIQRICCAFLWLNLYDCPGNVCADVICASSDTGYLVIIRYGSNCPENICAAMILVASNTEYHYK